MKKADIENRQQKILYAIIAFYIDTAEPVGSRAISQKFGWDMSPATVRNVMADLEEMSLIMQPHTSAGRVPTDKGYRMYVDSLLEPSHLTKDEESLIIKLIHQGSMDIDSIMQSASRAISIITNVAGIVLTPRLKRSVFKHIEFIPIDSSRVLTVLITGSGLVKNSILDLEEMVAKAELSRISEFLNEELEDMLLGDIKHYLMRRLLEERDSFYTFLKKAIDILLTPNLLKMEDHLYCEGVTCMMSHPEFRDMSRARMFLKAFEDKKEFFDLLYEDMEEDGVKVHIGKENTFKDMQDCSIVTCNYKVNDRIVGALAAIGPTRMEYSKVMSTIRYLSQAIGKVLEDF